MKSIRRFAVALTIAIFGIAIGSATSIATAGERVAAYSPGFAKRFALKDAQISLAEGGALYAIELTPRRIDSSRWCDVKLYLDSAMPIQMPSSDQSGSQAVTNLNEHFFLADDAGSKRWQQIAESDRRHFGRHQMSGYRLAAVVAPGHSPSGFGGMASAPYRGYLRDMFPGVTYVHLGVPCRWFGDVEANDPPGQIWLKRLAVANRDDLTTRGFNPKDFVVIDVPSELLRRAKR